MYLVTGAGGQLGRALAEEFADDGVVALTRADWDVALPPPAGLEPPDLVLHAAAWTNVDGAEDDPQGAAAVNVGGTANVAALGAPLVYYSTDYVFDGTQARAVRRVGRAEPAVRVRPHEAARRGGRRRARLDRPLLVALRADRAQLRPHDAPARRRAGRGRGRRRPARLADLRRPPRRGDAPGRARSRHGVYHVAAEGDVHVGRLRRGDLRGGRPRHAACGGSRPRSSAARRRGRRTRCSAARRARRRCRTGARACARRSPPSGRRPPPNRAAWRATPS